MIEGVTVSLIRVKLLVVSNYLQSLVACVVVGRTGDIFIIYYYFYLVSCDVFK